jgi:hypothetical protein
VRCLLINLFRIPKVGAPLEWSPFKDFSRDVRHVILTAVHMMSLSCDKRCGETSKSFEAQHTRHYESSIAHPSNFGLLVSPSYDTGSALPHGAHVIPPCLNSRQPRHFVPSESTNNVRRIIIQDQVRQVLPSRVFL